LLPDTAVVRSTLASADVGEVTVEEAGFGLVVRVAEGDAAAALSALKDSEDSFVFLVDLFGVDTGEEVEITYHVRSFLRDEELYVRTTIPYDATLSSVWQVHPAALLPERETAELLGLSLDGHPNPRRLLTTDGSPPLLRKSVPIRTAEEVRDR
jgi:NADH:ubiquinone oxidoreductase subunit C